MKNVIKPLNWTYYAHFAGAHVDTIAGRYTIAARSKEGVSFYYLYFDNNRIEKLIDVLHSMEEAESKAQFHFEEKLKPHLYIK